MNAFPTTQSELYIRTVELFLVSGRYCKGFPFCDPCAVEKCVGGFGVRCEVGCGMKGWDGMD